MSDEPSVDPAFREVVYRTAGRVEVRTAVADVYAKLQHEIETRRPTCSASGRCCRFEEFGHRLYVTTIELAAFVHDLELSSWPAELEANRRGAWDGSGCPMQLSGLCGVHAIRPFGCRVFFCDPSADEWQRQQYERFHGDLKRLHETMDVPYRYIEWRAALRLLGIVVQR